ncbi:MAG: hypothetical protein Q9M94_01810 [Candidatus Gracilibacteria bacterium]|nr:hypothetical protein [Candidatus Gracilibacteria bacterium]
MMEGNEDFFDIINLNYIEREKKEKIESDRYEKFDQCELNYNYDPKLGGYKDFSIYNKFSKIKSKIYDKIFEDTVMFDDYTNECSFSAEKGDKSIFILHGKEIGSYKTIYEMGVTNTSDGKSKITFSAELDDGKIVIVENGKYSIVLNGKKSLIEFDKKPDLNNQRFLKLSQGSIFTLDFRYNNFKYICIPSDYKNLNIFKNFKLKKYIDEKLRKIINKKYEKLLGKGTNLEILKI